jgi:hypothetical protein
LSGAKRAGLGAFQRVSRNLKSGVGGLSFSQLNGRKDIQTTTICLPTCKRSDISTDGQIWSDMIRISASDQ